MNRRWTFAPLVALAACGYRPARLADAPPVVRVADDAPIPEPRPRSVFEPFEIAEIYVRRPLMDALDAERYPHARDVNALDEVPRSSWFDPPADPRTAAARPGDVGPPVAPFTPLASLPLLPGSAFVVEDAGGVRWEMRVDEADRPEMRTAAAAIASRLVRAVGWKTPEVHVVTLGIADLAWTPRSLRADGDRVDVEAMLRAGPLPEDGRFRVAATRWPPGRDEGETPIGDTRRGDPNDRVPHRDRRTQRALQVLGAWLQIGDLGPRKTRDAYVGPDGEGHLEHFLVGLDDALGADDVVRPRAPGDPPPPVRAWWLNLLGLGLLHGAPPEPTPLRFGAVGAFGPDLDPSAYGASPPFEPIDRLLAADAWWAARRILALPGEALARAVEGGRVTDPSARAYLVETLEARRRTVAAYWASRVSPLALEGWTASTVDVRDDACVHGLATPGATRIEVDWLGADGDAVGPAYALLPGGCRVRVALPEAASRRAGGYLVLRMRTVRAGRAAPRAFEVHVAGEGAARHVIGVRH